MTRSGPLSGLRIVEFAGIGPGPLAGQLLADLGADVVSIDRASAPADKTDINRRNKRSIALNLKAPEGIAIALDLVAEADALIEGFRPGVMERLGLGPDVCLARNPGLAYTRLTGWGQTGPLARVAGHDLNYMSLSGALAAIGHQDRPPVPPLNLAADYAAGTMFAIFGLMAAIYERQSTGHGQVVDAAMCDGLPAMMGVFYSFFARGTWTEQREDNLLDGGAPFYRCYETADGKAMAVGPIEPQFFGELAEKLDLPELVRQGQSKDAWPAGRDAIATRIREKTRDEWTAIFEGSDACVTPVLTIPEAEHHPHNRAREIFQRQQGVLQASPAPRFSRHPNGPVNTPDAPGAQTADILRSMGMNDDQIDELRSRHVLT